MVVEIFFMTKSQRMWPDQGSNQRPLWFAVTPDCWVDQLSDLYFMVQCFCHISNAVKLLDYIQLNEIQENIDEITFIFQKVKFLLVKNIKCYFTSEKYQLLDYFRFFLKFPL